MPIDAPGLTFVLGRQSCDSRSLEPSGVDVGNAEYGGQEGTVIFDDVWVPNERVFMDGESEYAAVPVERFTAYHRRSYVCKAGLGDVLIGAAAELSTPAWKPNRDCAADTFDFHTGRRPGAGRAHR